MQTDRVYARAGEWLLLGLDKRRWADFCAHSEAFGMDVRREGSIWGMQLHREWDAHAARSILETVFGMLKIALAAFPGSAPVLHGMRYVAEQNALLGYRPLTVPDWFAEVALSEESEPMPDLPPAAPLDWVPLSGERVDVLVVQHARRMREACLAAHGAAGMEAACRRFRVASELWRRCDVLARHHEPRLRHQPNRDRWALGNSDVYARNLRVSTSVLGPVPSHAKGVAAEAPSRAGGRPWSAEEEQRLRDEMARFPTDAKDWCEIAARLNGVRIYT